MGAEAKLSTLPTVREGIGTTVREALRERYPEPGTVLDGTYRIVQRLGEGGMGVVLRARDERLDRDVAIKLIHPDQVLRASARARFLEEARAMARVRHPNVVEIHAFGEIEGAPYFVMEYVPGADLERWLAQRGGRPTLGEAWNVLDQACRGVQAIHDSGTTHRDLKSSNLLVGPSFRVVVTDLGLARLVEEHSAEHVVSGTPAYMAPELISGGHVAPELVPRADVYSLAVIAYELLTGTMPFEGETLSQTLGMQLSVPPPPLLERRHDLPQAFEDAVLAALEKDPALRTPSAEAFRHHLEAAWEASRQAHDALFFLVADDDPGLRALISATLRKAFPAARVEAVSDGARALDVARARPPSLVVSDLDMPEMNGVELTAALRSEPETEEVPIVIATAVGGPKDWQVLSQLGADSLMLKPFDPVQLVSLAENLVATRASWAPKRRG
ncbi:MAG TPA: serine/threonine-protein kinase [Sandaracinaceae bacterium LLY-WYZ-13_1]|nr:serine/threonine-protein kinase [Sandaracinaceae bacterium LLY-WYZ-13_1]